MKVDIPIGQYNDKLLLNVILMEANHILLRGSWKFDTKSINDGFNNTISFMHKEKIILKPLSLREVCEDQTKLTEKKVPRKKKIN